MGLQEKQYQKCRPNQQINQQYPKQQLVCIFVELANLKIGFLGDLSDLMVYQPKCQTLRNIAYRQLNNIAMEDSDEEGFHQPKVQFTTVKFKNNFACPNPRLLVPHLIFGRSPLSLHHELKLYQYPKELDHYATPLRFSQTHSFDQEIAKFLAREEAGGLALSQFFPRKLSCIYNKFHQNLLIKRDLTLIVRNVTRRLRNDQLITFHEKNKPSLSLPGLNFTSDFEGGNLHCVYKCKRTAVYYLFLQNDVNTYGYNIWFHFLVRSTQAAKYQFVIVNLSRPIKFQQQLLTYSSESGTYERKVSINCFESRFRHCQIQKNYYCVQFQYEFKEGESVYFSPTPPYSYSKLMRLIKSIQQKVFTKISVILQIAGKSQLGNYIPCLKITKKQKPSKKIILLTARQHPCQSVGSFVCEQMLKQLTSESDLALDFLQRYSVYVIPMINPDGVIHGNSRTNLLGYDINRSWDPVISYKSVECTQIWEFIRRIGEKGDLEICWAIDLHGHSKQLGYFAYFSEQNDDSLILNHLLKQRSQFYDANKCSFAVGLSKKQSLRGKLYQKLGINNSVTIQTSFYGFMNKDNEFQSFTKTHFQQIATQIIEGLLQTSRKMQNKGIKQELLQQISKNRKLRKTSASILAADQQLASDSNPQESYLKNQERDEERFNKANLHKTFHPSRTKTQIVSSIKRTTFTSHVQTKLRRSMMQYDEVKQKYHFLQDVLDSNIEQQANRNNTEQVQNQYTKITYHERHERINTQQKEYSCKKKQFQSPFKLLNRESKPLKLRRKVFSQQKYVVGNIAKQTKTEREDFYDTLRDSILESAKTKKGQLQRRRKSSNRGRMTVKHEIQKNNKLQTIVYPTSHEVGYDLSNKAKLIKDKIRALRQKEYGKKMLLSSFSQIFRLNHQK